MLLLISGPSGAGKSTFIQALMAADERLAFSVSTTTRPIRKGETDGVDYHFVDADEFRRLIEGDAFVEWADVHKHRYGTRHRDLQAVADAGRIPLLDLDVQGGKRVIALYGDRLVSVFLFPPSWEELERRLRSRGTDSDEVIATRLENARWEVDYARHYDYFIVNDDLDEALARMRAVLTAEACRRIRSVSPLD